MDKGIQYFDRCACGNLWEKPGKDFLLEEGLTIKCACGKFWKASKIYIDNLMGKKKKIIRRDD
jgi:hypothetical protein